jgi:hypothetical protein
MPSPPRHRSGWRSSQHEPTDPGKDRTMTVPFFGNFDLASLTLWLFWVFFALLVF